MATPDRLIVGITGASGVILGVQAASDEQRANVLNTMVSTFRTLGVSDRITDSVSVISRELR